MVDVFIVLIKQYANYGYLIIKYKCKTIVIVFHYLLPWELNERFYLKKRLRVIYFLHNLNEYIEHIILLIDVWK
jgi:hypothetical protein